MNFNPSALCFIMVLFVLFVHLLVYHSIYLSSVQCFGVSAGLSNDVLSQRIMNMRNPKGSRVRAAHDGARLCWTATSHLSSALLETNGRPYAHTHCTALHCVCVCSRVCAPRHPGKALRGHRPSIQWNALTCMLPAVMRACVRACMRTCVRACVRAHGGVGQKPDSANKFPENTDKPNLSLPPCPPCDALSAVRPDELAPHKLCTLGIAMLQHTGQPSGHTVHPH